MSDTEKVNKKQLVQYRETAAKKVGSEENKGTVHNV